MMEMEPADQRGRRKVGAASEAFARWLHHQYAAVGRAYHSGARLAY